MNPLAEALRYAAYLLYVPLVWYAGNAFCRLVFRVATVAVAKTSEAREAEALAAGRYIGLFERLLVSIGVVANQWEILVAVVALKTVARYQELDKQITAEYFLVGSLASLFWALLVTGGLLAYDRHWGLQLLQ
ncbi:MAG TPA: hypothetical protein VF329_11540 [Gammaproteobacteria bacterium]